MKFAILIGLWLTLYIPLLSQEEDNSFIRKEYLTKEIPSNIEIKVDGIIDESVWNDLDWGTDFTVHQPNNGEKPQRQTKFKIIYDENYIYIAYHCLDEEPEKIEARMGRRDNFPGDWVEINIDSYRDNATAFSFSISASGVKGDEFITDNGNNWDTSWNPIWYAATKIVDDGWTAEVKIPLSQLRFSQAEVQDWGFNITRRDFRADERSTYQFIPQNASGWVSNFARLNGLKNLKPKRQIETQPYIVTGRTTGDNARNRFNIGLDGKIGLTSNITMDYTVNPDFGQVDADPSVLNIDGYEVFFQERRPFFIENANLFDFQGTSAEAGGPYNNDNLFYSRRIGASPHGYQEVLDQADNVRYPDFTNILGATKISGKTKDGWSLGLLEAVTSEEFAKFDLENGMHDRVAVEPFTNFMVSRLSKDIDGGASQIGGTLTSVYRFLDGTNLEDQYHETATSGGVNLFHSWDERKWQFNARLIGSRVTGTSQSILNTQKSFQHYFQRPDAAHLNVDNEKTSLSGHGGNLSLGNYGGKDNISYQFGLTWRSPGIELNDIGFLNTADAINHYFWAGYLFPKPFSVFRRFRINYNHYLGWTFDGTNTFQGINSNTHGAFKNYWEAGTGFTLIIKELSTKALFGGPALRTSRGFNNWGYIGSDSRKKMRAFLFLNKFTPYTADANSLNRYSVELNIRYQVSNAFSISMGPEYSYNENALQNVDLFNFNGEDIYLTGRIEQQTLSASIRMSYNFTPNLTLEYWGQPFISKGGFNEFKYIKDPLATKFLDRFESYKDDQVLMNENGEYNLDHDGNGSIDYDFGNPNFNFMQFRSNAVMRWEYIPGSELFLVWSQGTTSNGDPMKNLWPSLREDLFSQQVNNNFLVKLTYRLVN